jgi:hypothetical protein
MYSDELESYKKKISESVLYSATVPAIKSRKLVDENLDTVDIGAVFKTGEVKLVFRLKDSYCMECVDSALNKMESMGALYGNKKIIVLATYLNMNDLLMFKRIRKLPFKVYNSASDIFSAYPDNIGSPYVFLMDSLLMARSVITMELPATKVSKLCLNVVKKVFEKEYNSKYPITMARTTSIGYEKREFNMGQLKYNEPAAVSFRFINKGAKPLVITSVATGCGCTAATYSRAPIAAGDTSSILISYDARAAGMFDRTVNIYSNATEGPITVRIMGSVKADM